MKNIFLLSFLMFSLASCAYTPYVNIIDPSVAKSIDYSALKSYKVCTFLGLIGDKKVSTAAKKANIKKVILVEEESYIFTNCTIVWGE